MASVAATLRDARMQRGGFLGAPRRFSFEESVDGEISDEAIAELFDITRRELGSQGAVTGALGTVEWKGDDGVDPIHVSVSRRAGRTTISILRPRTDLATLVTTGGVIGGVAASAGLAALRARMV